jgi:hypothetical protein
MKKSFVLICALFTIFGMIGMADAALITFTHTGNGSGSIGSAQFSSSDFTITSLADTSNVIAFSGGYYVDHTSSSINISNIGVYDFLSATRTFVNNSFQIVGFSRGGNGGLDLFNGPADAVFSAWDMKSGIGPVYGEGNLIQWDSSPVLTSSGPLFFDTNASRAIFQASTNAVPVPPSLLLLASGFIGLAGFRFSFKRK